MVKSVHRVETVIKASIEEVAGLLSDLKRLGECMELISGVEIVSDVKRGLGTRSRWTLVADPDNPVVWEEEVTVFEPPHRFGFATVSGGHRMRGLVELTSLDEKSTRAVFTTELLYEHPDPVKHEETMENQLASMKKCLER
ncbi:MAG: SRPBCC family protein [Candidatus Ranarchaeia archaeon]